MDRKCRRNATRSRAKRPATHSGHVYSAYKGDACSHMSTMTKQTFLPYIIKRASIHHHFRSIFISSYIPLVPSSTELSLHLSISHPSQEAGYLYCIYLGPRQLHIVFLTRLRVDRVINHENKYFTVDSVVGTNENVFVCVLYISNEDTTTNI